MAVDEENPQTVSEGSSKQETSSDIKKTAAVADFIRKQESNITEKIKEVVEEIFSKPVEDTGVECIRTVVAAMNGTNSTDLGTDLVMNMLLAAADAKTGRGVYSSVTDNKKDWQYSSYGFIGKALIEGQLYTFHQDQNAWQQFKSSWTTSSFDNCKTINELIEQDPSALQMILSASTRNDMSAISYLLAQYGIEFGFYAFKTYTEHELSYMITHDILQKTIDGKIVEAVSDINDRYLLDPYYRFKIKDSDAIIEYKLNCCTDFNYAKAAFARIVVYWLAHLVEYHVYPSYTYDIMRDVLQKPERMKLVMQAMDEYKKKTAAASQVPVVDKTEYSNKAKTASGTSNNTSTNTQETTSATDTNTNNANNNNSNIDETVTRSLKTVYDYTKETGSEMTIAVNSATGEYLFEPLQGDIEAGGMTDQSWDIIDSQPNSSVILIHSHPGVAAFSEMDMRCLAAKSIKSIEMIDPEGTKYHMSIGNGQRPDLKTIDDDWESIYDEVSKKYASQEDVESLLWYLKKYDSKILHASSDEMNQRIAQKYGWTYTKTTQS